MKGYNYSVYDEKEFDFVKPIQRLFGVDDLSSIDEKHDELFKVGDDSKTSYHKLFYDKYRSGWPEFQSLYDRFIADYVSYYFDEDLLCQKFPTMRLHLPENVAVGAFHNDGEFNHPEGEMNFIVPLTDSDDTASVYVESQPGKKDFEAMELRVGRLIMFNGNKLTHGNKVNETGKCRVSFDFRILPVSKYNENISGESMTLKTKFREGEYYKLFIKNAR